MRCRHSIRTEDTESGKMGQWPTVVEYVADTRSEQRILKVLHLLGEVVQGRRCRHSIRTEDTERERKESPPDHFQSCRHSIRTEDTERFGSMKRGR